MRKETIKKATKKEGEELQEYLRIMRKHNVVEAKKGKGTKYKRHPKHKGKEVAQDDIERTMCND